MNTIPLFLLNNSKHSKQIQISLYFPLHLSLAKPSRNHFTNHSPSSIASYTLPIILFFIMANYAWYAEKIAPYGITMHPTLNYDDWRDGRAFCALVATVGIYDYSLFADLESKARHGFAYRFFEETLEVPQVFSYDDWENGAHPNDDLFYMYMTALQSALVYWYEHHSLVSFK